MSLLLSISKKQTYPGTKLEYYPLVTKLKIIKEKEKNLPHRRDKSPVAQICATISEKTKSINLLLLKNNKNYKFVSRPRFSFNNEIIATCKCCHTWSDSHYLELYYFFFLSN